MIGALAVATLLAAGEASAQSESLSIGAPNRGRLTGGVLVEETADMRVRGGVHRWGTGELASMLARAAARLRAEEPGPRALVGELSRQNGGRLPPHGSHQSGRDADVAYFLIDEDAVPVEADFVELDGDACARGAGAIYCLDRLRTFLFFAAMVDDPVARVQWILVAADLRQLILGAGRRSGVDPDLYDRVERATDPRQGSEVHRNHFHVRILCSDDDRPQCQDRGPTERIQPYRDTPFMRRRGAAPLRSRSRLALPVSAPGVIGIGDGK